MSAHRRKQCRTCFSYLTLRHFYKHADYRDGHMSDCKSCKIASVAANRELKEQYYREQKRRIDARQKYIEQRKAYAASERGRRVHRAACRRYYRFTTMEMRA